MTKIGDLLDDVWDQYMARIGRRGLILFVLVCQFGIYGISLIAAPPTAAWWPVWQKVLLGIPVPTWGIIWVAFSIFLLFGAPLDQDRYQFAAAAGLMAFWAAISIYSVGFWGPAATYTGALLIVLINSGWPDVRVKVQP